MFNVASIAMFNTECVAEDTLPPMHDSATRLYLAAKELGGITGQSAVARALNESPQTVKNWETRGVSADGAISAELTFNCRAAWVKAGDGMMRCDTSNAKQPSADALGLAVLFDRIGDPSEQHRFRVVAAHYAELAIRGELIATLEAMAKSWPGPAPNPEPQPADVSQIGLGRATRI